MSLKHSSNSDFSVKQESDERTEVSMMQSGESDCCKWQKTKQHGAHEKNYELPALSL